MCNLTGVDVLILTGGQGTRLRNVVNDRPKTMADISGKPFLDLLINYLAGFRLKRFILCTGYMSEFIEQYYKNSKTKFEIIVSREERPLGTAGAFKNAERLIKSDNVLVLNGDCFCPVELDKFFDFYKQAKAFAAIVLTKIANNGEYGSVELSEDKRIMAFREKAKDKIALVNAGTYLLNREVFSLIPKNKKYSFEYNLFPELCSKEFYGFVTEEKLLDIGTPERYKQAKNILKI